MKTLVFLSVLALWACDPGPPDPEPSTCIVRDAPSFELGTGETEHSLIIEGQELSMISGPQGGCHFWLSVRTDGFAERRLDIQYDVVYADSSTTTGSRSSQKVRLSLRQDSPGLCQYTGYFAYLIEPWKFEDREVRIDVTVVDDLGRSASQSRRVIAKWPDDQPGRPRADLCGER